MVKERGHKLNLEYLSGKSNTWPGNYLQVSRKAGNSCLERCERGQECLAAKMCETVWI